MNSKFRTLSLYGLLGVVTLVLLFGLSLVENRL